MIELSGDTGIGECEQLSIQEKKVCQVLKQAFLNSKSHGKSSGLEIVPSPRLRSVMRSKLNRMGSALSRMNSKQRKQLLERWEKSDWVLTLKVSEITRSSVVDENARLALQLESVKKERDIAQKNADELKTKVQVLTQQASNKTVECSSLHKEKENLANELENVRIKQHEECRAADKVRQELKQLQQTTCSQREGSEMLPQISRKRKSFEDCSGKQKKRRIEAVQGVATDLLCCNNLEVTGVQLRNKDTGSTEVVQVNKQSEKENIDPDTLHKVLYAKERFSISNEAYHELSMLDSALPRSWKLKAEVKEMNKRWKISPTPGSTVGVQQSLKQRLIDRLKHLQSIASDDSGFKLNSTVGVKLTGDGTYIGSRQHIITFGFTIIDEGSICKSASGNHSVCIARVAEDYANLSVILADITKEVDDINQHGLEVNDIKYTVHFYLGADWKFLAMACGIDAANSKYACIWCTCSKDDRHKVDKEWSITDVEKGARTINSIITASKLPAKSPKRFNCSRTPLFQAVPIHRVIIDNLHLFLRITDNLINLLITELRRMDGIEKCTSLDSCGAVNINEYQSFLKNACKIPFNFYVCKESRALKWRDLTGPEKYKLFSKINIPELFPNLPNASTIQEIWNSFMKLNKVIHSQVISNVEIETFKQGAKVWLQLFLTVYQTKHVTPYMHAMIAHLPEFMQLYGSVVPFTQQGLEKLNDVYTQYYFRSTNHHELESLEQLLLKKNRLEAMEDEGYDRKKNRQKCSICSSYDHNKRKCSSQHLSATNPNSTQPYQAT